MVFSSVPFLFLFLPLFLAGYLLAVVLFGRSRNARPFNLLILLASLVFYAWGEKQLILIMLASTATDFVCGLAIGGGLSGGPLEQLEKESPRTRTQRLALAVSLIVNIGILVYFKYVNFFMDNVDALVPLFDVAPPFGDVLRTALPLGISFFTFQSMSYTIDVYRGDVKATRSFIDFCCFVTMFPQLIAGPILRYRQVAPQLAERSVEVAQFSSGVQRFIVGLGKKVLIADTLGQTVDHIYALPLDQVTTGTAWLGTLCFALQLYFDFSGYSDMAIGMGRMMGFDFPENFNYPYVARSIREYWTRWHISLIGWFRDYVYIPLGGSRVSVGRLHFNIVATIALSGLWHGASWTFLLWALFNGIIIVAERNGLEKTLAKSGGRAAGHAWFVLTNSVAKVLFRSQSLRQAWVFLSAMVGFSSGSGLKNPARMYLDSEVILAITIGVVASLPVVPIVKSYVDRLAGELAGPAATGLLLGVATARVLFLSLVLLLSAAWITGSAYKPFVYFQF